MPPLPTSPDPQRTVRAGGRSRPPPSMERGRALPGVERRAGRPCRSAAPAGSPPPGGPPAGQAVVSPKRISSVGHRVVLVTTATTPSSSRCEQRPARLRVLLAVDEVEWRQQHLGRPTVREVRVPPATWSSGGAAPRPRPPAAPRSVGRGPPWASADQPAVIAPDVTTTTRRRAAPCRNLRGQPGDQRSVRMAVSGGDRGGADLHHHGLGPAGRFTRRAACPEPGRGPHHSPRPRRRGRPRRGTR